MNKTRGILYSAVAGLLLAACTVPILPLTPETLAGCWQGEIPLVGATAQVQIAQTDTPSRFSVNGDAKFGGNNYPIQNVMVDYDLATGELKPANLPGQVQNVPIKLKVDGGEIRATATGTPFSISLKRCSGAPIASASPVASASPAAQ